MSKDRPPKELVERAKEIERIAHRAFRAAQEESDRGIVLVGHGLLEGEMKRHVGLLLHRLPSKRRNRLLSGALATLSVRLDIARAFGSISMETYSDAHALRKLRNDYAHRPEGRVLREGTIWKDLEALHVFKGARRHAGGSYAEELTYRRITACCFWFLCNAVGGTARPEVAAGPEPADVPPYASGNFPDGPEGHDLMVERIGNTLMSLAHESDRGIVLVGHAMIEEAVEANVTSALSERLDVDVVSKLMQGSGALEPQSVRLDVARAFGVIPEHAYRDARALLDMRKDCASQTDTFDLSDSRIQGRLGSLRVYERACEEAEGGVYSEMMEELKMQGKVVDPITDERLIAANAFVLIAQEICNGAPAPD